MAVSAKIMLSGEFKSTATEGTRGTQDKFTLNETVNFLDAAGALGCTKYFGDRRTLNSTTENLDLSGALTDGIGNPVVFTKVRAVFAKWNGASGTCKLDFSVSLGASTVMSGFQILRPGQWVLIVDPTATGMAITAATVDLVTVTTTASGTYDILFGGE